MRASLELLALFGLAFHCTTSLAEEPVFDSIDYAAPSRYLAVAESLGDPEAIAKQASLLKSSSDRRTLSNVLRWMETHLRYDGDRAYKWRNFDTVIQERCYGGCADQSIVCGVLLKTAGIPTVWVKTMDVNWIWDFKKKRSFKAWSGHVFLEVYLDGNWVLLDPGAATIYSDYSPKSRILPGNRFAYHKGNDPQRMIMSLQWEEWKSQTTSYFNTLDECLLPVDLGSAINVRPRCFIIANSPYYQFMGAISRQKGLATGASFNTDYDKYLPKTRGHLVLIETHAGVPIVDVAILQRYFPTVADGKQKGKLVIGETTLVFVDVAEFADQISQIAAELTETPASTAGSVSNGTAPAPTP